MAYIGVQPTDTYLSIASQQITGTGSATYTLNYSVSTEEDVAVFVNNVRQNVSSYTVSGNQLTLGGTISASDECWVLFLGRTVGTKTPAVGSVTNDMLAGSIANAKLANSSITLNGSAVSLGGSASVTNTPAFHVNKTSSQDIPDNTWAKITFDTELLDTDNCVSSNRFTPTTAGKYFIYATLTVGSVSTVTNLISSYTAIYKNGSLYTFSDNNWNGSFIFSATHHVGAIIDFNGSTDYVEVYGNGDLTTGNPRIHSSSNVQCYFGGYKIIGA